VLVALRLEKHPDKMFIGRIVKGFDFLGYHFRPGCLTVAAKTLDISWQCQYDQSRWRTATGSELAHVPRNVQGLGATVDNQGESDTRENQAFHDPPDKHLIGMLLQAKRHQH